MKTLNFLEVNKKFDLKTLSKAEKKRFYVQELFHGQTYIKKYIVASFLLVVLGQLINSINYVGDRSGFQNEGRWLVLGGILLTGVFLVISLALSFKKNAQKLIKYQLASLIIANILAFFCIIGRFYVVCSKVGKSPPIDLFIEGISLSATGLYITRFFDLLSPYWTLRIIPPCGYFIGWLVSSAQIEGQPGESLYVPCIIGILNILLVNWVHASFRWNLFTNRIESDIWNDIHKVILQKVPSPIAVFDIQGQITYANPEFNKLSENQVSKLFEKIINLRQRQQVANEEHENSFEQMFGRMSPNNSMNPKSDQDMKQSCFPGRIENLKKLLVNAIELLNEEKVNDKDYFVFDGKIPESTSNKEASFEVTLSYIIEYQKIVIILRDTTDHAQLVLAETSNEYKDKLLASVSHELRTPLNGNLSLIQATLNDSSVSETIKEKFLVPAYRSGKLLLHLINDILDFSQIAAKKLRLNFEEQPIRDTIVSCYQLLELQAKTKGIQFKLDIPDNLPLFKTDHDRVRQIILNLLGNALKFTFQGGITLKATIVGPGQLEIKVADTGIGIKPEDLGKLFKEFTRIDDPNQIALNSKGVGLGLTIANKLAKRLGPSLMLGGINVKSTYGEGSSFKFIIMDKNKEREISLEPTAEKLDMYTPSMAHSSLPSVDQTDHVEIKTIEKYFLDVSPRPENKHMSRQQSQAPTETAYSCEPQSVKTQKTVLIVDDEPFNILALESFLKPLSVKIDTAYNGKLAVEKFRKSIANNENYDLIFMDCQMPIMNGLEATRELRSLYRDNVPIIGCTALSAGQSSSQCYASGMTRVLNKPLSKVEVEQIIKTFL